MNELKRELSKLTGIDFFNPKFREVFKKYFPNDKDAEEEKVDEVLNDDGEKEENTEADNVENIDNAEETTDVDNIDTETTESETEETDDNKSEETETDEVENVEDVIDNLETTEPEKVVDPELLDAKIELELMKLGVSPERLASAKKLAKYEITSLDELGKVKDLIKEYPEWVRSYKPESFGMPVDEKTNDLTEEEKRLKEMGIDPRA